MDTQWVGCALNDALESLAELTQAVEDGKITRGEVFCEEMAFVYAKLNFAVNTAQTGPSVIETMDHNLLTAWPEDPAFGPLRRK